MGVLEDKELSWNGGGREVWGEESGLGVEEGSGDEGGGLMGGLRVLKGVGGRIGKRL